MGLRDIFRRSAKALVGEVVERVERTLDPRRDRERPPGRDEPPTREPARAAAPAPAEVHPPTEPLPEPEPTEPAAAEPQAAEPEPAPVEPEPEPAAVEPEPAPVEPEPAAVEPEPDRDARDVEEELVRAARSAPLPDAPESREMPDEEPILTRTMAAVLAAQGFHERALRIYDHLLAQAPEDTDLADEASAVRARMDEGDGAPEDEVAAVSVRQDALLVSWKVTERSVERARAVLGAAGTLTARVVVVARDASAVRSDAREHAPIDGTGEHLFASVPRGARCTASVGLRAGDRFVSVAHSRVVPT